MAYATSQLLTPPATVKTRASLESFHDKDQPPYKKRKLFVTGEGSPIHRSEKSSETILSRQTLNEFDRQTYTANHQLTETRLFHLSPPKDSRSVKLQEILREELHLSHVCGFSHRSITMNGPTTPSKRSLPYSQTDVTPNHKRSTRSGTNDGNVRLKLEDNNIHPFSLENKPSNLTDLQTRLEEPRQSFPREAFDDKQFEKFMKIYDEASTEIDTLKKAFPLIAGGDCDGFTSKSGVQFTGLLPFGSENEFSRPIPDECDGVKPGDIHRSIRESLANMIMPSKTGSAPAAPNFFLEGKGVSGSAEKAKLQACYYAAFGARAMHALQNYGRDANEETFDGNAYSFSVVYNHGAGVMQLYAMHISPPTMDTPQKYHLTQLGSYAFTHNAERFHECAQAYRNLRDVAKEYRDQFVKEANERARQKLNTPPDSNRDVPMIP